MRQVKVPLGAEELGTDPEAAIRLVNELTDRALAGEFEPVQWLGARGSAAAGPLRRSVDGRSVKRVRDQCGTRPGYSPRSEMQLIPDAQSETTARNTRDEAARIGRQGNQASTFRADVPGPPGVSRNLVAAGVLAGANVVAARAADEQTVLVLECGACVDVVVAPGAAPCLR